MTSSHPFPADFSRLNYASSITPAVYFKSLKRIICINSGSDRWHWRLSLAESRRQLLWQERRSLSHRKWHILSRMSPNLVGKRKTVKRRPRAKWLLSQMYRKLSLLRTSWQCHWHLSWSWFTKLWTKLSRATLNSNRAQYKNNLVEHTLSINSLSVSTQLE